MVQSERDLMDEVKRVCVSPVANRLASVLWRLHIAPLDCAISNHSRTGAGLLGYLFTASRQSERQVSHPAVYG